MSQPIVEVKCSPDGKAYVRPIVRECVIYASGAIDSHQGFDPKTQRYTFTQSGRYLVQEGEIVRIVDVSANDFVTNPRLVISEQCVLFSKPRGSL